MSEKQQIENLSRQNKFLGEELRRLSRAIERLDKAMASPERIEQDTRLVGGFVSSLHHLETAEEIVERAIQRCKQG